MKSIKNPSFYVKIFMSRSNLDRCFVHFIDLSTKLHNNLNVYGWDADKN
jgi:hypothetical protein